MQSRRLRNPPSRRLIAIFALLLCGAMLSAFLASGGVAPSSADLGAQITTKQDAATRLQGEIAADDAQIQRTSGGLAVAQARLNTVQAVLSVRTAQLVKVEKALIAARDHLTEVENQLEDATSALASNLVANYEGAMPDLTTVVVNSHGFADLLNELDFMRTVQEHNAEVVSNTKTAREQVSAQATALGSLEARDLSLTDAVLAQRDQVAALQAALLNQRLAELTKRAAKSAVLHGIEAQVHSLEAAQIKLDGEAAPDIGGIQIDTGGMVQPTPGAPAAVAQIMAAGNAIATLPYICGGGHASFHADGYDCSGSVSYVLAAAGLLSAPEVAADFESYGDPGPGKWVTIWASGGHVFMYVAGWRFDTIALAETGTRWSRTAGDTAGFVERHPPGL